MKFTKKQGKFLKSKKRRLVPQLNYSDFNKIKISLASPESIRSWSYGEVRKPETINYRTFKPERDGLFCEKIFGPVHDWECNCGKYKYIKHKGITCDRCGVEVTESKVRRERMGHIELATPIIHIWFLRKNPSKLAILLDMKLSDIEKVVYYARYIVLSIEKNENKLPIYEKQLISDEEYQKFNNESGLKFKAGIGASAILELVKNIDLEQEVKKLRADLKKEKSEANRIKIVKRLRLINGFLRAGIKPEWMILRTIPVLPPDLRPLVPLDGGRFAASDLNDLYRRIINRNNRLRHLESLKSPELMIHNEKRLLQESVDSLIENGAKGKVVTGAGNRPLKSLSDIIKGKTGRFRQNLLGKRVDYSGRSVIVVGPELKLNQCGLPKEMALELFKPYIIREIINRGLVSSLKAAKRFLEKQRPEVWDILENIIKNHPVMLNRAPTLHRLGIQAFEPVLIEGRAIRLHPLTCAAFNADFDGDQMAVHIPLSAKAIDEVKERILSTNNLLLPSNGRPVVSPSQDMVLGCYYLTKPKSNVLGEGMIFSDQEEVITAHQNGGIDLNAKIKVKGINQICEKNLQPSEQMDPDKWIDYTTVGRVIFNNILPKEIDFINKTIGKKDISHIVEMSFKRFGNNPTVDLLDKLKKMGFKYATLSGLSISVDDLIVPPEKEKILKEARREVHEVESQARKGIITNLERYNRVIDIWTHATDTICNLMFDKMSASEKQPYKEGEAKFNSVFIMADSGSRGSRAQVRQLGGMRGLMAKPAKRLTGQIGEIIEQPVESNFREGLTVLEYFISTHGGRKGLADTALKTSEAGYLTRRLIDVAHDVVVTEEDCGTLNGVKVGAIVAAGEAIELLSERIVGRCALDNVVGVIQTPTGEYKEELIVKENKIITVEEAENVKRAGIETIRIRSVLTCETKNGVCAKCYGINLATGKPAELGDAVGIIAAQSIGEPGTQLTLRTFHIGGTASRIVKEASIVCEKDSTIKFHNLKTIKNRSGKKIVVSRNAEVQLISGREKVNYKLPYGTEVKFSTEKRVLKGTNVAEWDPYTLPIITEYSGKVRLHDVVEGLTMHEIEDKISNQKERVIVEYHGSGSKMNPQLVIMDSSKKVATYPLPVGTHIVAYNDQPVEVGDIIAKIPREYTKSKDITGGLPRVAELFDARKPKNAAIISELEGVVKIGSEKGTTVVTIESDTGIKREYLIPQGKHLIVYEGDRVSVGEPLTDGTINPHDILHVLDIKGVQEHLVNEIQEVYRLQGVMINDKHIEVIVRQMLLNVKIENAGDSNFLIGETINKFDFDSENKRIETKGGKPAEGKPVLLGITRSALSSKSFISAASFQETPKVLADAAVRGAVDNLTGLKENVIIGHLIPAGTGFKKE
ncbi:MAG: DNA-directed RNA polymerase subunit beta' [Elusimicrobia bacterium]|nr:DNA-directed RNA polymerase subunit beta' [Elusimicrobiota bacterium]